MEQFVREHWMLGIAALAALASMFAVAPDEAYLSYFDWQTIGCLFCVLAVANALRRLGMFDRVAKTVLAHNQNPRTLAMAIMAVTAVFSMTFTNDVALIVMLPLSATLLVRLEQARLVPAVFALQALTANLCGMITPFGSPQNLYLYSAYSLNLGSFLAVMALPFVLSVVGIAVCTWFLAKPNQVAELLEPKAKTVPLDKRLTLYVALFGITLLGVFHIIPIWIAVVVVAIGVLAGDRRALAEVDYALLLTFVCFFIFSGNMARVPVISEMLGPLMDQWGLMVSALASQVISNVPAAVLLSHFTDVWQPLLLGVNIGGAGTFIGSLASLIAIRHFAQARKLFAPLRESTATTMGRFLGQFALLNFAFFFGLLVICQVASGVF